MAVVGVVAGMVAAGTVVLPSIATVTATDTGPTGTCMPTIGLTGTIGIGITKQSAERCRFTDRAVA